MTKIWLWKTRIEKTLNMLNQD